MPKVVTNSQVIKELAMLCYRLNLTPKGPQVKPTATLIKCSLVCLVIHVSFH